MQISNYPLTILLYNKYGHPYLTYLPQKILSKLFFGSEIPYLPTIWTYVQNFVVFLECSPYAMKCTSTVNIQVSLAQNEYYLR